MEKIYIARHGFRLNWINTTWKSETGLPRDPPLAAYGLTQAQELANFFQALPEDERPTAIFSSPYYRCLQTSQPTAQALNLPIHVEHGISEWYSPVVPNSNLLHPRPESAEYLQKYFSEIDKELWPASVWYPSRKGETVGEVHARVSGFLELFNKVVVKTKGIDIRRPLFVTHAATAIVLVRGLLGEPSLGLKVGCCSLSELHRKSTSVGKDEVLGAYVATKLADGSHMEQGASREWGFDDIEVEAGRVVEDPGVPGTESEEDFPLGGQLQLASNL
ncbi:phosphoglycerate mutase-like protein [Coprinopsis marcescibilis]|uniref:Phosphoglycerate mutase-like protein n=1 Tax=Coprinopsis marcescibilis TaxID=230819 RepID=A0A5C3LDE6_COPMA|nr:phosphoglycerate mutase-like protein [Coprinopsis marcescibilis]